MAGKAKRKKRHQNRLAMFAIAVVLVALMGVLGYQTHVLRQKRDSYAETLTKLEDQIAEEEARSDDLDETRIYTQTKQYIEEQARSKLGLVNPDEIVLKPES